MRRGEYIAARQVAIETALAEVARVDLAVKQVCLRQERVPPEAAQLLAEIETFRARVKALAERTVEG